MRSVLCAGQGHVQQDGCDFLYVALGHGCVGILIGTGFSICRQIPTPSNFAVNRQGMIGIFYLWELFSSSLSFNMAAVCKRWLMHLDQN